MTKAEAVRMISRHADYQIGYREEGNNGNIFARDPEVIKAYGGSVDNLPWCDIFYDYLFCHVFGAEAAKKMTYQMQDMSAACKRSYENYKANGALYQSPEEGDQVFFYVGGEINHTGYVRNVTGMLITVEGNSSDMVANRQYELYDNSIAGYGRPDWSVVSSEESEGESDVESEIPADEEIGPEDQGKKQSVFEKIFGKKKTEKKEDPETAYLHLEYGDGLNAPLKRVKAVQVLLNIHDVMDGQVMIDEDGEFGKITELAVRRFQERRGLEVNGIVDQLVWEELIQFEV